MQRIRQHLTYANVMATIAVFVVLGGTTYAATGDFLKLGNPNSANKQTSLSASPAFAGKALQLTNTSTGAGATALGLTVGSGRPPFIVNSGTKVTNLNADKLDGLDSTGFLPRSNVKSLAFTPDGCVNATDPGCSTSFTLGGLSLGASCYVTNNATVAHLELDNTSGTSEYGVEYVSGSSASQSSIQPGLQIVDLSTAGLTPPEKEAQGSLVNLFTSNPETANFAALSAVDGSTARCGLRLLAVKAS